MDADNTMKWDGETYKMIPVSGDGYEVKTKTTRYPSHTANPATREAYIPIGRAHVEQALKIEMADGGCNSGIGLEWQVHARYGLNNKESSHPQA